MNINLIESSLEQLAQAVGDPAPLIYERLFEREPALEPLFAMDTDGSVRGEMLHQAFDALLDLTGPGGGQVAHAMIAAEFVNHCAIGIPTDQFLLMFSAIDDVVQEVLGVAYTPETESAWKQTLDRLSQLIDQTAVSMG